MKSSRAEKKPKRGDYQRFFQAVAALESPAECDRFLGDLCTPTELEAMVDRWRAVRLLSAGKTYREINQQTGISVTTVGRVARFLAMGSGGYDKILNRVGQQAQGRKL